MDGTETAAPQSTAAIAASVMSEAEATSQDTSTQEAESSEARIDTTQTQETAAPTPELTKTEKAELSAAAKFLQSQGHHLTKADGRDNWLPAKTVERMLDRYVDTHQATWKGERSVIEQQLQELRGYLDEVRAGVSGDPRAFLQTLAQHDPRYQAFLEQRQAQAQAQTDDRPQPDVDLGNGQWTYSPEGVEKLTAWKAKQLLDAELKPWKDQQKEREQQRRQEQQDRAIAKRATEQMETAKSWPNWAEYEGDVLTKLQEESAQAKAAGTHPRMTLREAYLEVKAEKLSTDRATIVTQMQAGPKAPALARQATDAPRKAPLTTHEIAAKVIADAQRA